jgi:hypothetical protein
MDTTKPTEPTEPTKPTEPTEPTDPTEPTEPTDPIIIIGSIDLIQQPDPIIIVQPTPIALNLKAPTKNIIEQPGAETLPLLSTRKPNIPIPQINYSQYKSKYSNNTTVVGCSILHKLIRNWICCIPESEEQNCWICMSWITQTIWICIISDLLLTVCKYTCKYCCNGCVNNCFCNDCCEKCCGNCCGKYCGNCCGNFCDNYCGNSQCVKVHYELCCDGCESLMD